MIIGFNPNLLTNSRIDSQKKNNDYNYGNFSLSSTDSIFLPKLTPKFSAVTNSQTNAPKEPKQPEYILGKEQNGQRIIDKDSVMESVIPMSSRFVCPYDARPNFDKNTLVINGNFDDFMQSTQGDCYLLSSIYSVNHTKNGKNLLKNNIQYNKDGSITVTLPGAIKAKKGYEEEGNGDKCAITGKYTITPEALKKVKTQAGKVYAYGDIEVMITELAMEAYRAEVIQTNKALNQNGDTVFVPGQYTGQSENNPLSGGVTVDATYILTGKKSEFYLAPKTKNIRPYIKGEFGFVEDNKKFFLDKKLKANKYNKELSVTNLYNKDSDLQKMLDKYKGKEDEFAITFAVQCGEKLPDGKVKIKGGHALSVSKITDAYVEIVNPHNTTTKERIPRGIFEQMVTKFCVAKM